MQEKDSITESSHSGQPTYVVFQVFIILLKLKKIGKTTRSFRYDINQISYDYTVKMKNKFKGLDLIDRVPEEPWTEVRDIVQRSRQSPWKRNAKR